MDDGLLAGVDVVEEPVEGGDPLDQPPFQHGPLLGVDNPGEQVHGPSALGALVAAVHRERDPLAAERLIALLLQRPHLLQRQPVEPLLHRPIVIPSPPPLVDVLIKEAKPRHRLKRRLLLQKDYVCGCRGWDRRRGDGFLEKIVAILHFKCNIADSGRPVH